MDTYVSSLSVWLVVWVAVLVFSPEGPRAIATAYRINFCHGVLSTLVAALCVAGYIPDSFAVPCSLSYFIVDLINMLLNDFYFKVASYQGPTARKAEYFHHVLCAVVCVSSKLYYTTSCNGMTSDPIVRVMLAEVSTPFLIYFRQTKNKLVGLMFLFSFIASRTVYQCLFLMPEIFWACEPLSIRYGMTVPYILLQLYFTKQVIAAAVRGDKSAKKKEA